MYLCPHLTQYHECHTYTYPDSMEICVCEFCAAELGFCTSCGTFEGRDMSVPESEQSEPEWVIGGNISIVSWGDVQMCDKCAGLE